MPSKFFENNVYSRAVYYILKTIAETNSKIYLCQKMNYKLESITFARPSCWHGKLNVNPRGRVEPCRSNSSTNSARQEAIWSKSSTPVLKTKKEHLILYAESFSISVSCQIVMQNILTDCQKNVKYSQVLIDIDESKLF